MEPVRRDRYYAWCSRLKPAIAFVVVLVVLSLAAHTAVVRQYVLEYGRNYLRASQGLEVEVEDFDYNLFALSASLRGVTVRRVARDDLPPFFAAQEVYLRLRFSDLIAARLTLEQGRFARMTFRMVVDEEGGSNLPSSAQPDMPTTSEPAAPGLPLFIEDLQASGPIIEVEDRQRQFHVRVPQWNLNIRGDRASREQAFLFVSNQTGLLTSQGSELPLSQLALDLGVRPDGFRFRGARARLGDTDFSATGEIRGISRPIFDLMVNASVDLRDVANIAALEQRFEGRAVLQASVRQSLDDLEVTGTLSGENLTLGELENVGLSARPSWNSRSRNLALEDVALSSPAGTFLGQISLALGVEPEISALRGRFEDLNLALLTRELDLPVQIDSRAAGDVDLQWPALEIRRVTGRAAIQLDPLSEEPSPNLLPVSGSLSLDAQENQLSVSAASLRAANAELAGEITLESLSQISGEVRGNIARLSETASALERFLGMSSGELARGMNPDGTVQFQASLGGRIEAAEISLLVDGADMKIGDASEIGFDVAAVYSQQRLSLDRADIVWQDQTVSTTGTVTFGREHPLLDLDVRGDGISVQRVFTVLGRTEPLVGRIDFSADLSGDVASLSAEVVALASGLEAYGEPLGQLSVEAQVADQRIEVSHFALEKPVQAGPDGSMQGSGSYDMESGQYSIAAIGERLNLEGLTLLSGLPIQGTVALSANGSGNRENHSIEVQVNASGFTLGKRSLGDVSLTGAVAGEQATITLQAPQLSLESSARVRLSAPFPVEFDISTSQTDLSLLEIPGLEEETVEGILSSEIQGTLALSANGSGIPESTSLTLQLDASSLEVGRRLLGDVSLSGNVAANVATLRLQAPQLSLESNARVRLSAPFPVEFDISTSQTDLSVLKISGLEEEIIEGILSSELQGTGEVSNWRRSNVTAQIRELRVGVAGQEIRNEGILEARLSDGVFESASVRLSGPGSEMSVDGSLPLEQSSTAGDLRIRATLDTEQLLRFVPGSEELQAAGRIEINAALRGSFEQLDPSLELSVRDGSFSSEGMALSLSAIGISARTRDGSLVLEKAEAEFGSGRISADGELPLGLLRSEGLPLRDYPEGGVARFRLQAEDLRLESMGVFPEDVAGQLGLAVQAEAAGLGLGDLKAEMRFNVLSLNLVEVEVQQTEPARLSLREGVVSVDSFRLTGPGTSLELQGQAKLTDPTLLDLNLAGNTDVGILTLLRERAQASGDTRIELSARGTLQEPQFSGTVTLSQGRFALADPPLQVDQLDAQIRVTPGQVTVDRLLGTVNGGEVEASGTFGYSGTEIGDVAADFSFENLFLNFPEGLRTSSEADIRLTTSSEQILVGGEVRIVEGSFRENLDLQSELLAFLRSGQAAILEEAGRDPFLSRLRYNLPLRTINPIVVDNNLARLSATANLRIVGTYYRPSVTGRLSLEEGGELHLAENDYVIDTGSVDFTNVNRIEPSVNVVARTAASGYDIELRVVGTSDDIETTLTSEPPLPEPDIVSVLITGRTLEEARSGGVNVAAEQGLSYLAGRMGSRFSERAQETIGLSQVRIEPNLIASESDPAVRLTLGQDLTRRLRLIYSMNLADSGDQIYVAEYGIGRRFNARGVKQSDNTYRFGLRHDVRAGGTPQQAQASFPEREVGEITVAGRPILEPPTLLDMLDISSGDSFDFLKLREGLDRIEERYRDEQYLEARVRLQQERIDTVVNLRLSIEAGPKVEFLFEGINVPGRIQGQVAESWQRGVFDAQRIQDTQTALRRWLVEEDYLDASIEQELQNPSEDLKRVVFRILPGIRYENRQILFEGASALDSSDLEEFLQQQQLISAIHQEPTRVASSVATFYRRRGFLDAQVQAPRYEHEPASRTARVIIAVQEGPRYVFGDPVFEGNSAFSDVQLRTSIPVQAGMAYNPALIGSSADRLEELYWGAGYNNVLIEFSEERDALQQELRPRFRITENQQDVVESVEIRGNDVVGESFIRQRIPFEKGDLFDFNRTAQARTNLYKTGAFTLVDFDSEPVTEAVQGPQRLLKVLMNVQEVRPYRLLYGGFFDTERGPGVILDFENRNTLGSARVVGVRTRYDSEVREVRGYFGQPLRLGGPSTVSVTGFRRREITGRQFLGDFIADRTGFSLQQEFAVGASLLFNYGYRFERTHTFDREPDPNCPLPLDDPFCRFDDAFNIAPLTSSLAWDSRDDPLDATRGMFTSHSVEFATETLGSDLRFIRYFGQFYRYEALFRPAAAGLDRRPGRPRLVYAGGVRAGLGRGFGNQGLILSERFLAGGGTTIRGFEQDTVGPKDFLGDPAGGEALLIINNELRFPLISIFDGVTFLDLGNVYSRARDLDPFDVRKTAGVGLRVRTPYFLLRLDYGHKLDRKAGESSGELFFSIGQAF